MLTINRFKPHGDVSKGDLKNYSYNSAGQFYLVFSQLDDVAIPATKCLGKGKKKKVEVHFDRKTDKEIVICLSPDETTKLRQFLNKFKERNELNTCY